MRRGNKEVLHHIVATQGCAADTSSTTTLSTVVIRARSLGVSAMRDGDDNILFGDEILVSNLAIPGDQHAATLIGVLRRDLSKFFTDDGALTNLAGKNVLVVSDLDLEFVVLVDDLLAFQRGETAQLHVENRRRLNLINVKQFHQTGTSFIDRRTGSDQGDDVIECIKRLQVTQQNVGALLSLAQAIARSTNDHFDLMCDPVLHESVESEGSRHTIDEGDHVAREVVLQGGVLEQVVQHNLGNSIALKFNDQTHTGA